MITVVIADDHPVVRGGLRWLLDQAPHTRVVGEAADGRQALARVAELQPSVLIVDLQMPELSGLEVCRRLPDSAPHTRAVVLSMHSDEAHVLEALRSGAAAYLLKDGPAGEIVQAVQAVVSGHRYVGAGVPAQAVDRADRPGGEGDPYDRLTPREREVLYLAADDRTGADIAAALSISPRTVEIHRASLMRKLKLRSQTDLVRFAIRRGLLAT